MGSCSSGFGEEASNSTIQSVSWVPILSWPSFHWRADPYTSGQWKTKYQCLQNKNNPRIFASASNEQKGFPKNHNLEIDNKISKEAALRGNSTGRSQDFFIYFFFKAKVNFENAHPVEEGVFLWL